MYRNFLLGKELLVSAHGVVLVTYRPEGTDIVCRQRSDERRVKNNWRNLTYVPEISDRKHRVRYTYLSPGLVPLTQFYSVGFSQSRSGVKKCVFNKSTIKV